MCQVCFEILGMPYKARQVGAMLQWKLLSVGRAQTNKNKKIRKVLDVGKCYAKI